jgi:hypothetical protein
MPLRAVALGNKRIVLRNASPHEGTLSELSFYIALELSTYHMPSRVQVRVAKHANISFDKLLYSL